jgi:hypothetical protein
VPLLSLEAKESMFPGNAEEIYIYWSTTADNLQEVIDSGRWYIFYDDSGNLVAKMSHSPLKTIYGPFEPPAKNKGREDFKYHLKPIDILAWNGVLCSLKNDQFLGITNNGTGTTSKLEIKYLSGGKLLDSYSYQFSGEFVFVNDYIRIVELRNPEK